MNLNSISPLRSAFRPEFERATAFWHHDKNPKRPYVRLRNGQVSNGYFNGEKICERPVLLDRVARMLVGEFIHDRLLSPDESTMPQRVVGPAMGAITIAHSIASYLDTQLAHEVRRSYAEKQDDAFAFRRSAPAVGECALLVEDTITTGGSAVKVAEAVRACGATLLPYILCLCNRSGVMEIGGLRVIAAVNAHFVSWKEGDNPFTPGGRELIAPVENVKDNWHLLTQEYA